MPTGEQCGFGSAPRSAAMDAGVDSHLSSYPPPLNLTDYAKKPLPALPPYDRRSLASSFGSEVDHAFTTPKPQDGCPLIFEWEREGSGKSVRLYQSLSPVLHEDVTRLKLRKKNRQPRLAIGMNQGAPPVLSAVDHHHQPGSLLKRMTSAAESSEILEPPFRQTLPRISSYKLKVQTVPPDEILSPQPRSSVQKILKLTGNMSPNASLSQDTPSLHNSSQKIRQLTGLDVGLHQLHPVEEEASAGSSEASSSIYSLELEAPEVPDDASYEPAESVYSPSYAESVNEVLTPLTIPRYINPVFIPRHIPDEVANESSVAAALRLSGFVSVGASLAPADPPPAAAAVQIVREAPPSPPDSTYQRRQRESDAESVASLSSSSSPSSPPSPSSSSDESASALELEPTVGMLYHDTAISIAKSMVSSPASPPSARDAAPDRSSHRSSHRSSGGGVGGGGAAAAGSAQGSAHSSSSPTSARPFSLNLFRKKEPGLSERRGRGPTRLEGVTSAPASWKQSQRTPYPPVSSTIRMAVQESEDNQARFSLLARIFTVGGGGGGGSGSGGGGKRESGLSNGSGGTAASDASQHGVVVVDDDQVPTSAWSPDTPDPPGSAALSDENGSPGILSRTLDHARHAAGLRTKAEKAEQKRETLRGKIKVLKSPGHPRASMAEDGSL